jgi:hypothetical protein
MGRINNFILALTALCIIFIFLVASCNMFEDIPMRGDIDGLTTKDEEWQHQRRITAEEDIITNAYFGFSVAVSDKYVIVGAHRDEGGAGAAYIFTMGDWTNPHKITPDVPIAAARFGGSVGIDGNYAIVGAYNVDRAYVFKFNGADWVQVKELTGAAVTMFGYSVSIKGNHAIVGAYSDNTNKGEAYIYYKDQGAVDGWGNVELLLDSDGAGGDQFGFSVSISENYAIVGASNTDGSEGKAFIYHKLSNTDWDPNAPVEIKAKIPGIGDAFGRSVAITDDYAVVGASGKQYAYAFIRSGSSWSQEAEFVADPSSQAGDYFAWSVAISGTEIIVGAYGTDSNMGSAFGFTRSGGSWEPTLNNPLVANVRAANQYFGYSVAVYGKYAVVGAYGYSTAIETNAGAAHIFRLE